jgi:ubiquinone/menaquinone biosynthesis C-methylase UbiE
VELPGRRALALLRSRLNARELPILWGRLERRIEQAHLPAGPFGHARRWLTVLKESATRANRLIDVRELMQATGLDEHVAKADAYFSTAGWQTMHARKPFADTVEAEALTRSISVLIPHLELAPGIRLLDFGAGTCWSSLIWAYLGCTVIATDVSANALRFGEERLRADPVGKDLPVSFLRFDGRRFDLPDASVDRIVGIDTLHHVLDIPATLTELSRVLAPGGIVAFSEPGPLHSMGPQAQHEMATTGVIENDIRVAEIRTAALAAGFADMRVAWFSPHARLYSVEEFDRIAAGKISGSDAKRIVRDIGTDMANIRIFFFYAHGARTRTSENQTGLAAHLEGNLNYNGTHPGSPQATRADP